MRSVQAFARAGVAQRTIALRSMSTKAQKEQNWDFATLAAKHYEMHPGAHAALSPAIVATSTYLLKDAATGARLSDKLTMNWADEDGFLYTRWGSPTNQLAGKIIATLERAEAGALVFSSGMAAISTTLLALLNKGDHVVLPASVYGGTHEFASHIAPRFGIEVSFVDPTNVSNYKAALKANTKVVYAETPCNPTCRLTDLAGLGAVAKAAGVNAVVDSTFASPYHQTPLTVPGITVSIQSATKYLGGHSDLLAGSIAVNSPQLLAQISETMKLLGNGLPAFDSFLLQRGIKTLDVRMERHSANAMAVASFLESHPKVARVYYPGLASHPDHALAMKQMRNGFGGMLAFEVKGGTEQGKRVIEGVKLINLAVSLGGVESLIEHAASMTHAMVPRSERLAHGISDGLIRFSVGLESPHDLIADLQQALNKA